MTEPHRLVGLFFVPLGTGNATFETSAGHSPTFHPQRKDHPMKICAECDQPARSKGLCNRHYLRARRTEVRPTPSRPGEWVRDAACTQVGPDPFFPDKGEPSAPAKRICDGCPVIQECLDYALAAYEVGVWGGTTRHERDAIRRKATA